MEGAAEAAQGSCLVLPEPLCCLQAEHELRLTQTEFDRQAEVTRLLLEGISSTHVSPPGLAGTKGLWAPGVLHLG